MSGNGKSDPARAPVAWKTIERVADQAGRDEMEQLVAMTPGELDRELEEAGFGPDDAANLVKAALAASPVVAPPAPAPVVSLAAERSKRGRSLGWLVLVAAAAAVVIGGGGAAVVVALRDQAPAPTSPVPSIEQAPPQPAPEQLAKQQAGEQRQRAVAECGDERWGECLVALQIASGLDPAGDQARDVRRLRRKAEHETRDLDAKPGPLLPRSLAGADRARFVKALGARRGQALRLVCAPRAEPQQLCGQIAATLATLGWVVTRATADGGKGMDRGMDVLVGTGADDATQDAADALADALESAYLKARGPDDAPAGETGLTLAVGPQ